MIPERLLTIPIRQSRYSVCNRHYRAELFPFPCSLFDINDQELLFDGPNPAILNLDLRIDLLLIQTCWS